MMIHGIPTPRVMGDVYPARGRVLLVYDLVRQGVAACGTCNVVWDSFELRLQNQRLAVPARGVEYLYAVVRVEV